MLPQNKKLRPFARKLRNNATRHENKLWHEFLRGYSVQFNRQVIIMNYIADFLLRQSKTCDRAGWITALHGRWGSKRSSGKYQQFLAAPGCTMDEILVLIPDDDDSSDHTDKTWQMHESGWFRYCNGIIYGRPDGYKDKRDFTLIDALEQGLGELDIPVIFDADIGHIPPQMQIVNGAIGSVEFVDGKAAVKQKYLK